jgi:GT2 family glycosyltransferase
MAHPAVSVIVVTYNSEGDITECLRSVFDQDYQDFEVVMVDNHSEDRTVEIVREDFPRARLIENDENCGLARGWNVGIDASRGKYVVFLNPDTRAERGWLSELVGVLEAHEDVGACQSGILLYDKPDTINAEGNDINYLGFTWCRNYGKKRAASGEVEDVVAFSGCSTIVRSDLLEDIGLADEEFFMYLEDTDLSLRIGRKGYRIVCNPASVIYHKYRFERGKKKLYYLERNRLVLLLKHYDVTALLKILPAFVLMEAGLVLLSLPQGWLKEKVLSYLWVARRCRAIRSKGRAMGRKKGDQKSMFAMMSPTITFEEIQNPVLSRVVNPVLAAYYRLVLS